MTRMMPIFRPSRFTIGTNHAEALVGIVVQLSYVAVATFAFAWTANAQEVDVLSEVKLLRISGQLAEAQEMAEQMLSNSNSTFDTVRLHLELAAIHSRMGLHQNTRPVAAALSHIDRAAQAAEPGNLASEALIALAKADYYYRAELPGREFPLAELHSRHAIDLFAQMDDRRNEAYAVHRLGLIEMQRRNLDLARKLFEQSLSLDQEAGERHLFRGEYERHVGFVILLKGNNDSAIAYFERSLVSRRLAGAIDASMFAAITLASSLVNADRYQEAWPLVAYATMIAQKLKSPVGMARVGLVQGRLFARTGDYLAARIALDMTIEIAQSVDYSSLVAQASKELDALAD